MGETLAKVGSHLDALQRVADARDGQRLAAIVRRAERNTTADRARARHQADRENEKIRRRQADALRQEK